jgi:hypothetical protein
MKTTKTDRRRKQKHKARYGPRSHNPFVVLDAAQAKRLAQETVRRTKGSTKELMDQNKKILYSCNGAI